MIDIKKELEIIDFQISKLYIDNDENFYNPEIIKKKWTRSCLEEYKKFIQTLENVNTEKIIELFRKNKYRNVDNTINVYNLYQSIEEFEKDSVELILSHPERPFSYSSIREQYSKFIDVIKKGPEIIYFDYEDLIIENPIELRKIVRKQMHLLIQKEQTQINKIYREYLNLFCDNNYYFIVENFFCRIYDFCSDDMEYNIPNKDILGKKLYIDDLKQNNKERFLEELYYFFLNSNSLRLNNLLEKPLFPIIKRTEINESLNFFSNKNNCDFIEKTNLFINNDNRFFLGKIVKILKSTNDIEMEKAVNAVLDLYHMQENFSNIDSIFKFSRIKSDDLQKNIDSNLGTIKEILEKKYKHIDSHIPDLFLELLHKQKYFFKIENIHKHKKRTNDYEEYLDSFKNPISNDEKQRILESKCNPCNINKSLGNYEIVLYNAAARILNPHVSEKLKEDYLKQLAVFYPEVYRIVFGGM